ncbi:hypothetical protein H7100_02945 [Candidatus Saccharibacteria bacterium]|nr:hypothetical protein [Candidatus Saccharibacteria bacterium]
MNEHEKNSLISVESPENRFLIDLALLTKNSRGEPLTWGATPLGADSDVRMKQLGVKRELSALFDVDHVPSYISPELAEYIDVLNMSRTFHRETRNVDSFNYREKMDLRGIPLEALEVLNRALTGYASPAELLFLQKLLGIPSIELASLTHPYGQHIELLKNMRPAVNEAIILMGGVLVRGINPIFQVEGCDNLNNISAMQGIHMTRKTAFGYLEDSTEIVERSSFVILLDQLPDGRADAIRAVPYGPHWSRVVGRVCGLSELAPILLNQDQYDKAAPVSTTVLAVNENLEKKLLSDDAKRQRQLHYLGQHASKI